MQGKKATKDIEIALKQLPQNERQLPPGYQRILEQQYATKYLESINVYPTKNSIDTVLRKAPLSKAVVNTNWSRELITINPFGLHQTLPKAKRDEPSPTKLDLKSVEEDFLTYTSGCSTTDTSIGIDSKLVTEDNIEIDKESDIHYPTPLADPLIRILKHNRGTAETLKLLMKPPDIDIEDIRQPIRTFTSSLGEYVPTIKLDKTGELFKSVRKLLNSRPTLRLMGLLIHFCYWNIIHPQVRQAIRCAKESEWGYNHIIGYVFNSVDLEPNNHILDRQQLPDVVDLTPMERAEQAVAMQANLRKRQEKEKDKDDDDSIASDVHSMHSQAHSQESRSLYGGSSLDTAATETSLSGMEKEQLYLQLEFCLIEVFKRVGGKKKALVIGRQSLISCCHYVIDDVFTTLYPWFAVISNDKTLEETVHMEKRYDSNPNVITAMKEVNIQLRGLLHTGLSDLIDPIKLYISPSMWDSLVGTYKVHDRSKIQSKSRFYNTSTSIKAIFGDTKSDQTKRFFARSEGLTLNVPGAVDPDGNDLDGMGGMYGSRLNNSAQGRGSGGPSLTALDFNSLFEDQPEADYYPVNPPAQSDRSVRQFGSTVNESRTFDNSLLVDQKSLAEVTQILEKSSFERLDKLKNRPFVKMRSKKALIEQNYFTMGKEEEMGKSKSLLHTQRGGARDGHGSSISKGIKTGVRNNASYNLASSSWTDADDHDLEGVDGDASSASVMSLDRSMVRNSKAIMPISLQAKAMLMDMMVNKSTSAYEKQTRTRISENRIKLLRGNF